MTIAMPTTMLAHALGYARRGWPVFPCDPKTKRPLVPRDKDAAGKPIENTGGLRKATTDPAIIEAWWRKWPDALIGVRLGHETGLWVIDFDPRGETVDTVKARFAAEVGELPRGPVSRTQSGGEHVWLKMPDGEVPKNSAKRIKGVDWRAEGGYVIVPPSRMANGARYEWLAEGEFPSAPDHVLDLVFRRGKFAPPVTKMAGNGVRPSDEKVRRYCLVALDKAASRVSGLVEGQRNQGLNDEALAIGHLVGAGGITEQEAFDALRGAALSWGITDADRALVKGGTLDRAIRDGARSPADLSHVGARARREELPPHDPETGEVREDDEDEPDIGQFDLPEPAQVEDEKPEEKTRSPFKYLGYNRDHFYYLPDGKGQIVALKAGEHRELRLLEIADMAYWRGCLFLEGDAKITKEKWLQLADGLMRNSERQGIFDETRVRGRGAWIDGKKPVVHTGSEVVVERKATPLNKVKSRYIYEAASPWEFGFGQPASNAEANRLVQVCSRLTWADRLSGALLAGWCVIAPVSGALKWRPHIWITGPASSGKTTALNDITGRIVGPAAERFDGKTTEAAVRQTLGYDARPVIIDEAEGEDQAGIARMQGLLDLARVSSSGGKIAKGSANHRAVNFVVRSCFCFSAINTSVRHHADESRISKLVLIPNKADDAAKHYSDLVRDIDEWFTPEYASRMFVRSVDHLPVLLHNADVFTSAAAIEFRSRRAADQLGPMLAGFYLCHSTAKITHDKAIEFIKRHDWSDYVALNSETDESRLFQFLMSRKIRITLPAGNVDVTIGAALDEARGEGGDRKRPYGSALAAVGIKLEDGMIAISDSAENTRALFREKPEWSADWKRPLRNLPGAMKSNKVERFGPGMVSKVTWLPYGLLDGTYVAHEPGEDVE